eukprot:GABV01000293.1.p3 GENE.GABV01000293.1~~GABV01000293.1.p3  ORF type:complete len:174 (-),score=47.53 GABV01000293.1:93-614(-)
MPCTSSNRRFSCSFDKLKPGALFCNAEWAMTDKFDETNELHQKIKRTIEKTNGITQMETVDAIREEYKRAGFEIVEDRDWVVDAPEDGDTIPWFSALPGGVSFQLDHFRSSALGITLTHLMVQMLEYLSVAPKGSVAVHQLLSDAAWTLRQAGELEIFTPMHVFLVRKPAHAD